MLFHRKTRLLLPALVAATLFGGCTFFRKDNQIANYFSLEDDKRLGLEVSQEIENQSFTYPVLPEKGNEEVYRYVRNLRDRILGTGRVQHARDFDWKIKIIRDDETQNAFCAPGGHIYIFTGLIKFLDSEDQLAGVIAHEIAHAANRHYTRHISKSMPARTIADALLGKSDAAKIIAVGLVSLKYSRAFETEADEFSVHYLCGLGLRADGAAAFFRKIESLEAAPPQWLSTHPSPKNRIEHIEAQAKAQNCKGTQTNSVEYQRIKMKI